MSDVRVALAGHGMGVAKAVEALKAEGHDVCCLVTHPRREHEKDGDVHERQRKHGLYASVFEVGASHKLPLLETRDINAPASIRWVRDHRPDFIFSIGLRHILRSDFLHTFPGRVLNLHTAPLPKYRGGASDTWMILHGEREAHGVCHVIDSGVDTGPIVASVPYRIPPRARPIDIYRARTGIVGELALLALERLAGEGFEPTPQDRSEGFTLPKLKTDVDGQIVWAWPAEAIERHVRGFGSPYRGAFTFFRGMRIRVHDGCVEQGGDVRFHPLSVGLIVGTAPGGGYRVVAGDGVFIVTEADGRLKAGGRLEEFPRARLLEMAQT